MSNSLILCDCAGSQPIDADLIADTVGVGCSRVFSGLCTTQIDQAGKLIAAGGAVIACAQEKAAFRELAGELGVEAPGFVDLRDRAGWSDEAGKAAPKMAALAAEALLPGAPPRSVDVSSDGLCLIVGPGEVALELAGMVSDALAVTVLITDGDSPPVTREFDVLRGRLKRVGGALGGFEVLIDALQRVEPGGRGAFGWSAPRDGARSECDIVIDVTGGVPMVPAPEKREGYLRADPRDPVAVARLAVEAVQLTGVFEKPLYVRLETSLCAHSRAGQAGCSNCLDHCPTGAITPAGDHVAIDPMVCAGCGECAALCPSGAIAHDDPPLAHLLARIEVLARIFRAAGGGAPRLLVHDAHGAEMIRLAARFGAGLPADVIPLELRTVSGFGHAEMLAALAHGFAGVDVALGPRTGRGALMRELALAEAIAGAGRLRLLDEADPDALIAHLYGAPVPAALAAPVLAMGNRRQVTRLAAQALNPDLDAPLALPAGAPYGAVLVDTDACTLCLSCASLCPSGALGDNPDLPQLRFQEDACLQCGLCVALCPENAITLQPRLDLGDGALSQRVLHEEEPYACIECGALFGVRSTIERIVAKLEGVNPMFAGSEQSRVIRMCDNCRIEAQFARTDNPMAGDEPPRVRVSEDYLPPRKDH